MSLSLNNIRLIQGLIFISRRVCETKIMTVSSVRILRFLSKVPTFLFHTLVLLLLVEKNFPVRFTVSIPIWIRISAPLSAWIPYACFESHITVSTPSAGAKSWLLSGAMATLPIISVENRIIDSFNGTIVPDNSRQHIIIWTSEEPSGFLSFMMTALYPLLLQEQPYFPFPIDQGQRNQNKADDYADHKERNWFRGDWRNPMTLAGPTATDNTWKIPNETSATPEAIMAQTNGNFNFADPKDCWFCDPTMQRYFRRRG